MKTKKWQRDKLNVLIPMAGAGSRFQQAGYTLPKPIIDINGKTMIEKVVENLNLEAHFIFITQKSHREKYNLDLILNSLSSNCTIIDIDGITEGAACTTLLAKKYINSDDPLLISNSDHFYEWNSEEFHDFCLNKDTDGNITVFNDTDPKWSFAKLDEDNYIKEVAEKKPISNIATAGVYQWKKGSDYVKYAEQMIEKNIRVNNEFYVCPVLNEAIADGKKFKVFFVNRMWGLGTPEDLNYFLINYK